MRLGQSELKEILTALYIFYSYFRYFRVAHKTVSLYILYVYGHPRHANSFRTFYNLSKLLSSESLSQQRPVR